MALFPFLNTNRSRTDNSTVNASVQTVKRREDEKAADKKPSLDYSENDSFSQPTRNNPVVNTRETSTEAARPVMGGAGRSWDVAPERGATRNFEPTAMPEAAKTDMGNNAERRNSVSGADSPVVAQTDTIMGGAGRNDFRTPARKVADVINQVYRLPQSIAQGVNKITGAVPSLAEAHGLSSSPETMIMNQMGRQDAFSYFHEALSGADSTPTIAGMGQQLNIDLERQAQAVTPAAVDIYSQTANQFVDVVGEAIPSAVLNTLTTGNPIAGGLGAGAGGLQAISSEMWEGSGDPNKALAKGAIAFGAEMLGNKAGKFAGEVIGTGAAGKAADIVMEGLEENIEGVANAVAFKEHYALGEAIKDNLFGMAAGLAIQQGSGNGFTSSDISSMMKSSSPGYIYIPSGETIEGNSTVTVEPETAPVIAPEPAADPAADPDFWGPSELPETETPSRVDTPSRIAPQEPSVSPSESPETPSTAPGTPETSPAETPDEPPGQDGWELPPGWINTEIPPDFVIPRIGHFNDPGVTPGFPEVNPDIRVSPRESPIAEPNRIDLPQRTPQSIPERRAEPVPRPAPDQKPSPQPSTQPAPSPEAEPQPQPSVSPWPQPQVQPKTSPAIYPSTEPQIQPVVQPQIMPYVMPQIQPYSYPAVHVETQTQTQTATQAMPAVQTQTQTQTETETSVQSATQTQTGTETALQIPDQDRDDKLPEYNSNLMRGQGATGEVFETMGYNQSFGILSSG